MMLVNLIRNKTNQALWYNNLVSVISLEQDITVFRFIDNVKKYIMRK